ncbi:enolase [Gossypium australe]|uniref:phosphopyruvate hydratase n=1 Tax=Gossypium australe TaxID=47621 RepID=A0A5B6VBK2_9ROSI|nr:enolase [Gossypium australe]
MGMEVYYHFHKKKSMVKMQQMLAMKVALGEQGFELLKTAIAKARYTGKVVIGMDIAASEFYGPDKTHDLNFNHLLLHLSVVWHLQNNNGSQKNLRRRSQRFIQSFVSEYPIVSIEDPFDQDDWEHYSKLTNEIREKVEIVGNDLLVTNPCRSERLAKYNQVNTLPF